MNYLTLENITKTYGEKVLFQNISLQISKGEKIALVAKNGTGKTTLLRVLSGEEAAEGENSNIILKKDITIGYLRQEPSFNEGHTILEAVFESDNQMIQTVKRYKKALLHPEDLQAMQDSVEEMDNLKAWDFEAQIKEILGKLNIKNFDQHVANLSGGQRKRLAVAKLLIEEPDFLILDEPTNHLDMDMIEWLENFLQRANLTVFMVTHDRYFLERICSHIVELSAGNLYRYRGNYSEFLEKKYLREENESINLDKSKKLFKKELDWIRRQPKARSTKAKSRVDNFDVIKEKAHQEIDRSKIQIEIKGNRMGSKVLEAEYISKSYGDLKIIDNFFYKFRKGEKVGIVGPNGVGKTTFLKMLTQQLKPDSGKVIVGDTIVFGYYTQSGIQLQKDKRVIDVIQDIAEYIPLDKGRKLTAAQLLERFLFDRKHQQVYVSQLSGGERRRLYLLTVLMDNPNFLILDEPTNDLDIITLNILEEWLIDFPGCVIIVTHDRYFMDKLVDHLFIFQGDGKIKDYNGNYSKYRAIEKVRELEEKRSAKGAAASEKKVKTQEEEQDKPKMSYLQRKEFNKLEKEIDKLEVKKAAIMEQFNGNTITPEEIEKLSVELGEINNTLEDKEMRWLELSELA